MKNKKIAKELMMLLIIVIGIGGACFAAERKGNDVTVERKLHLKGFSTCDDPWSIYYYNDVWHWIKCKRCNTYRGEYTEQHTLDGNGNCKCGYSAKAEYAGRSEVIGAHYKGTCKHKQGIYDFTTDWHWIRCGSCNNNIENSGGPHEFNNGKCKCGYTGAKGGSVANRVTISEHRKSCNSTKGTYYYTANWHWVRCNSCNNNIDGYGSGPHSQNGNCVCGYERGISASASTPPKEEQETQTKDDQYTPPEEEQETQPKDDQYTPSYDEQSGMTTYNTCCGSVIPSQYHQNRQNHYRVCAVDPMHHWDIYPHDKLGENNSCSKCGYIDKCTGCEGLLNSEWQILGDKHYRVCTLDSAHHNDIGFHDELGDNGACSVCNHQHTFQGGYCTICEKSDGTYCPICGLEEGKLSKEWYDSEDGKQHYKKCMKNEEHKWYEEDHIEVDGKCSVCLIEINKQEENKQEEVKQEVNKQEEVKQEVNKQEDNKAATGFYDVAADLWSADAIKFVVDKKIMNGMGDGTFNPLGNVTKAQLATIIKRVAEDKDIEIKEATGNMVVKYSDEKDLPDWAKDAILLVGPYIPEESGYVTISPRQFGSNTELKRKQVALALVKALRLEESVTVSEATKKKIEEIKKNENITNEKIIKAAEIMYETGIMQGDGTKLNLENNISRQEMAKTIQNLYSANLETREKCSKCSGYIVNEWEFDENEHWKVCSGEKGKLSHVSSKSKAKHTYDDSKKCTVCEYVNDRSMCGNIGCKGEMEWVETETMHVLVCKKNKAHVALIEGHRLDSNNKCTVCEKVDERKYESKFVDFTDANHWAWRNVCYMAEKGIVKGVHNELNDTYILYPDDTITAEAFVALLSRVLDYKAEKKDEISNSSVYIPMENPDSYWSIGEWKYLMNYLKTKGKDPKKEIQKFLSNNANSGSDKEITENYRKEISRERVAYLLGGLLESNVKQESLSDSFEDWSSVEPAYKDYFERLSSYDIIRGVEDNGKLYASPEAKVTRVQAIALIDRLNSVLKLDYKY